MFQKILAQNELDVCVIGSKQCVLSISSPRGLIWVWPKERPGYECTLSNELSYCGQALLVTKHVSARKVYRQLAAAHVRRCICVASTQAGTLYCSHVSDSDRAAARGRCCRREECSCILSLLQCCRRQPCCVGESKFANSTA